MIPRATHPSARRAALDQAWMALAGGRTARTRHGAPQTRNRVLVGLQRDRHRRFRDPEESCGTSLRSEQYFDYWNTCPCGQDGKVILDYGCGPGHDLVGFVSIPSLALIGMDVSAARERSGDAWRSTAQPELVRINENTDGCPCRRIDRLRSLSGIPSRSGSDSCATGFRRVLRSAAKAGLWCTTTSPSGFISMLRSCFV